MPGIGRFGKRNKDGDFTTWFVTKVIIRRSRTRIARRQTNCRSARRQQSTWYDHLLLQMFARSLSRWHRAR